MDLSPRGAQVRQSVAQRRLNATQISLRKTVVLPQGWRPFGAVQVEHCLAAISDDVDVRRAVIVGIDHHTKPANSIYCRHDIK